jgi:hypothetical protein
MNRKEEDNSLAETISLPIEEIPGNKALAVLRLVALLPLVFVR